MNLACADMKISMTEALAASTINSAFALGVSHLKGSIEIGKCADFVILDTKRFDTKYLLI
jgi:imidazolonepropionase